MNPFKNIQMQDEGPGGIVIDVFPRTKSTIVETAYGTLDKVLHELYFNGSSSGGIAPGEDAHVRNIYVDGSILPNGTDKVIGDKNNRFKAIYVDEVFMSTNTLYIGDTPILGTNQDTIQIKADPNQSINMMTSGAGVTKVLSESGVEFSTSGMNANVVIQAKGVNSQTNIAATSAVNFDAPSLNFSGDSRVDNLTVRGNLNVLGDTVNVDAEQVRVKDNIIEINKGEPGSGVTAGTAGLRVDRGDAPHYNIIFDEADDLFKVGMDNDLEAIASREWVKKNSTNYVHPATHPASMITGLAQVATSGNYDDLINKPTSFPPASHNHDGLYLKLTGGTITGGLTVNTNTNKEPLVISRSGNLAEATKIGVDDGATTFEYTNDEFSSRFRWILNNTDTESSDGSRASTHTLEFGGSNTDKYLQLNGNRFYHQGFKPTPADIGASPSNHGHDQIGGSELKVFAESANEINFGGTSRNEDIYFGFRSKEGRPIPTNYIFGSSATGTSNVKAKDFYASGNKVYHAGNKPSASDIGASPSNHDHNKLYYTRTETNNSFYKRRGVVAGDTNWNTVREPGVYKVQMSSWVSGKNAPEMGLYSFGLLEVIISDVEAEGRVLQIYHPHKADQPRAYRMCNNEEWQPWQKWHVEASADLKYYHAGHKPTLTDLGAAKSQLTNGATIINEPVSVFNQSDSSVVGVLKILLPKTWSSTMLSFDLINYDYSGSGKTVFHISGYNYASEEGKWVNTQYSVVGKPKDRTVRFGYDTAAGKCCILIGQTTTNWAYPKFVINNLLVGHAGLGNWDEGWQMSIISNIDGIEKVVTGSDTSLDKSSEVGDDTLTIRPHRSNEVNFGGNFKENQYMFFGYRDIDGRPAPTKYAFGSSTIGTAEVYAKDLYASGNKVYHAGNKPTRTELGAQPKEGTIFTKQTNYVAVRTDGRTAEQFYEFWDNGAGWATLKVGEILAGNGQNKVYHAGNKPSASDIGALPTSGGTLSGQLTLPSGQDKGLRINQVKIDTVSSKDLAIRNVDQIRFGDTDNWNWNDWAGLKYSNANKTIYMGGANGEQFSSNGSTSNINIDLTQGVSMVKTPTLQVRSTKSYENNKSPVNTSQIGIVSNNNGLGIGLDGTFNSRNGWIQVGHSDDQYYNSYGDLKLNPKGGAVTVGDSIMLSGRDISINGKRALVGFGNSDGNKLHVNYNGDYGNGVELRGPLEVLGAGAVARYKALAGDHMYLEFYPNTANLSERHCWMGYGSAGDRQFTIQASIGGKIRLDPGVHGTEESWFSNGGGHMTDPWPNQPCAIKGHGNIACNDRVKAWNGFVNTAYAVNANVFMALPQGVTLNNTASMIDSDDIIEEMKGIQVYQYTQTTINEAGENVPTTSAFAIDADTLPIQAVDYNGDGDDHKINHSSLEAMLAESCKFSINKIEELAAGFAVIADRLMNAEEKIKDLEARLNGNTSK